MDFIKRLKSIKYKVILILFVAILGLTTALAQQRPNAPKPYTVMVYMNPSDLESGGFSEGSINILKILAAKINEENMNVVIEIGGTEKWTNTYALDFLFRKRGQYNPPYIDTILPETEKKIPSWFKKRIDISKNTFYKVENGDLKKIKSQDKKNMGDPKTLSDFINYGMNNFPAENYSLVFFGHAHGATRGFGYDENFDYDTLTVPEMKQAFENSKVKEEKFDFILFDSCYMANLEVAYTLKDYADYLVASQDTMSYGAAYHEWLRELSENPDMPTEQITKSICNSYDKIRNEYQDWEIKTGSKVLDDLPQTLSVIRLDAIKDIADSIEQLFSTYGGLKRQEFINIVEKSVESTNFIKEKDLNHMDLKQFANNLREQTKLPRGIVENLETAVSKAVVYNVPRDNKLIANGISIYMPLYMPPKQIDLEKEIQIYKELKFSPSYTKYVEKTIEDLKSR